MHFWSKCPLKVKEGTFQLKYEKATGVQNVLLLKLEFSEDLPKHTKQQHDDTASVATVPEAHV